MEVGIAFVFVNPGNSTLNAHLSFQLFPEKHEGYFGVGGYLLAFGAVVVGEEYESIGIQPLEQHYAGMWLHAGIHSSQCHGIDLGNLSRFGFGKPGSEESERIKANSFLIESSEPVILSDISNI